MVKQVVVQPNQGIHLVRPYLAEQGLHLKKEVMQKIRGRFFISVLFERGEGIDPIYESKEVSRDHARNT